MPFAKSTPAAAGNCVSSLLIPLLALAGLACAGPIRAAEPAPGATPQIQVLQGTVQGRLEGAVRVFKGVPYAEPPVGDNRWRAPQPPRAWGGVRDASRFGPACPSIDGRKIPEGR